MPESKLDTVRRFGEAWGRNDLDGVLECAHPDIELDWSGSLSTYQGIYRGHEGLMQFWAEQDDAWAEFSIEILEAIDVGDERVVTVNRSFPSCPPPIVARMMLCFIEPSEAIRVMAESMGREARRSLLSEVIEAWVDDIPEEELSQHYARAVNDLDHEDLSMLAAWHATLEVGTPVASAEFLVGAFEGLGEHRRDVLKLAARFRGDEAFLAGVGEEEALDIVLPWLSEERVRRLCSSALEIYVRDRLGSEN